MIPPTFRLMMGTIADMLNQSDVAYQFAGHSYYPRNKRIHIINVLNYPADTFNYRGEKFSLSATCNENMITIDFTHDNCDKIKERKASYHSLITELKEYSEKSISSYSSLDSDSD